ncbi:DNA primase family protein [Mammaliicoccus fleurettii]|uniref:DNA primase family protein n=1 Tax=Mammaliicoccus fleurettii TaxID=150056 RepID=UPI001AAC96F0|nr:DNA primase family protein [Mammaliicoccus fleurettii]MBO3062017.1 nucleoside triphosphatase [Mammaliicoccus fleurettii]
MAINDNELDQMIEKSRKKVIPLTKSLLAGKELKEHLKQLRIHELSLMKIEAEEKGKSEPKQLSTQRVAMLLQENIKFILFDLEKGSKIAMYLADEGIYTQNVGLIYRIISWLEPTFDQKKCDTVIFHIKNESEVTKKTASRFLIPVNNGVYNLKTKTLESFKPDYVFTTKITTNYVKHAKSPDIDGWNVDDWIKSIACNDSEIELALWQTINESLNGSYTRDRAIFLIGDGANGKGTYHQLLINLIGANNVAMLKLAQFEQRFMLSTLEGKTLVMGDENPSELNLIDSSNYNSVVTGDPVLVEFKNQQPFMAEYKCAVIQSMNNLPTFNNKTDATERRMLILPFNAKFEGENKNRDIKNEYLKNKEVLEYVLYKAINMDFEDFNIPKVSLKAMKNFKQDNDPIVDFKENVFDELELDVIPKRVLYEVYKEFCKNNGYKFKSMILFSKKFKELLGNKWGDDRKYIEWLTISKKLTDNQVFPDGIKPPNDRERCFYIIKD